MNYYFFDFYLYLKEFYLITVVNCS